MLDAMLINSPGAVIANRVTPEVVWISSKLFPLAVLGIYAEPLLFQQILKGTPLDFWKPNVQEMGNGGGDVDVRNHTGV